MAKIRGIEAFAEPSDDQQFIEDSQGRLPGRLPNGRLVSLPPPIGHMELENEAGKEYSGKISLRSEVAGTFVDIDTMGKKLKKTNITKRCQSAWNLAREAAEKLDKGATGVYINIRTSLDDAKRQIVEVGYKDATGTLRYVPERDLPPELLAKAHKIRSLLGTSDVRDPGQALQIANRQELVPQTAKEFIEKALPEIEKTLTEETRKGALQRIVATEGFVQSYTTLINTMLHHKKKELEENPQLPLKARRDLESEIHQLTLQLKKLENLDRLALFTAVAFLPDFETGELTQNKRIDLRDTANQISNTLSTYLHPKDKQRVESWHKEHWFKSYFSWGPQASPNPGQVAEYSHEGGNLVLPDQWEAKQRSKEHTQSIKPTPIEQFIVEVMMNLNDPEVRIEDHPVLAGCSDKLRQAILGQMYASPPEGSDEILFPKHYSSTTYENSEGKSFQQIQSDEALKGLFPQPIKKQWFEKIPFFSK